MALGFGRHHPRPDILWKLLFRYPKLANPSKRDASALRLVSWLIVPSRWSGQAKEEFNSEDVLAVVNQTDVGKQWARTVQNLIAPQVLMLFRTFL